MRNSISKPCRFEQVVLLVTAGLDIGWMIVQTFMQIAEYAYHPELFNGGCTPWYYSINLACAFGLLTLACIGVMWVLSATNQNRNTGGNITMTCYRNGGCGPYEHTSCSECPASKPGYAARNAIQSKPEAVRPGADEDREVVIVIEGGTLTGVYTPAGQPVKVVLCDLDNIGDGDDATAYTQLKVDIDAGKVVNNW